MHPSLRSLGTNVSRIVARPNRGQEVGKTVYLTHVKWVTGKDQLVDYFSQYGHVASVNMFYDRKTGLHRGFASLTFKTSDSAMKAMEQQPHVVDGDMVNLEPYVPKGSKSNDMKL